MSGAVRTRTPLGLAILNFNFPNWGDDANENTRLISAAFSLTGVSVSGIWTVDTAYTNGVLLVDVDTNEVYRCDVTHVSAASGSFADDRAANPTYWILATGNYQYRGEWETVTEYVAGDLVYEPDQYVYAVCLVSHTSSAAIRTDEALGNWLFIVDLMVAVTTAEDAAASAAESAEIASGIVSGDIGPAIAGSPQKFSPVAGDRFGFTDSAAAHALVHITWGEMLDRFETINDLVYAPIVHTHVMTDITDLAAELALLAPKANAAFTGTFGVAGAATFGSSVTLAGDPASALQAATKQYVDGLTAGIGKRQTVRVATTANIAISTALNNGDSLDGITLVTGDLILVKNQTSQFENGIYIVGAVPARATDYDTFNDFPGTLVAVQEGSTNADSIWLCTSNVGGTIEVNNIVYSKMVTAGELLAANNLSDIANAITAFTNIKQAATIAATGVVELAVDAEAIAKADTARVLTPSNLAALGGTATFAGLLELATTIEAAAGVDTARAVTAAGVAAAIAAIPPKADVPDSSGVILGTADLGEPVLSLTIPSDAIFIIIGFAGVTSNANTVYMELGDSGGYETSGYSGVAVADDATPTAVSWGGTGVLASFLNVGLRGIVTLALVDIATNTWAISVQLSDTGGAILHQSAGDKSLTATLDRIRIAGVSTDELTGGKLQMHVIRG